MSAGGGDKRRADNISKNENETGAGIEALVNAVVQVTTDEPALKKTKKAGPKTPGDLLDQVKGNEHRLPHYEKWFKTWFESTFKMEMPDDGPAYAASQHIFDAFIVNNYVRNHPENDVAQAWNSGMALNSAIRANYGTLIEFAAQNAYNESTWGAVMNQVSSYMTSLKTWAKANNAAAQQFFKTKLGELIKLSMKRLAIGATAAGVALYAPYTLYGIVYYAANLGVQLGIYGSIAAGIIAVGAFINNLYDKTTNKLAGIDIVAGSENILTILNNPRGLEAAAMLDSLKTYTKPTLEKLKEDWNAQMKEQDKTPQENLDELITKSRADTETADKAEAAQRFANEVSRIWWGEYKRVLAENDGKFDAIKTAKTDADAAVDAFKTALEGGGGAAAAGGGAFAAAAGGGKRGGRTTKRKRQSKNKKARKSHKKRRTKSKKHRK